MSKVSICIPVYGMKGKGSHYLHKLLSSVYLQSKQPDEIVISDHSDDTVLFDMLYKHWASKFNIRYYKNENKVGCISANLNNCINKATGDIIDFMLQDDYYSHPWSLNNRICNLGDKAWALSSTYHHRLDTNEFYWHLIPSWRDDIHLGFNSIGSPSLLTMKRDTTSLFDENLFMLTDCDYYKMMYLKHGMPNITNDITVITTIWDGQSQNNVGSDKLNKEKEIVIQKYGK
jgi:glycosyltransferase involved in cell wall biosynthesis